MIPSKKVLIGVCGSIAAYKSAYLVRELIKAGHDVRVIMTGSAKDFVSPLTFSTLSKNPVFSEFSRENGDWNNHVELAEWADVIIIAPATANTISKMATGLCDNLLLAVYLSSSCPVCIAPAMDLEMYRHPATKRNLELLIEDGINIIPAGKGELASGLIGEGRMAEPEAILEQFNNLFKKKNNSLNGFTALVSAGPTYEAIDPVRFIGNHSSGKMGFAVAEALANEGAQVTLIAGPVSRQTIHPNIRRINVISAKEMHEQCIRHFPGASITVMAAAVADFTPSTTSTEKIKKEKGLESIPLKRTVDILSQLGQLKVKGQLLVGFALETENEIENAKLKIKNKNLDLVVLNSLRDEGAGFQKDTNKVTVIDKNNNIKSFELKNKTEVAIDIVNVIKENVINSQFIEKE